jgi:hypothetical protein
MSAKTVTLLASGTAATAGDKAVVTMSKNTPFLPGRKARAVFLGTGTGTAPVYQIDGSADNSTWVSDVCDSNVIVANTAVECTCYEYMRVTVTTAAGTAGTLGVHLEGLG